VARIDDPAAVAALNRQVAVLTNVLFPTQMLHAWRLGDEVSVTAARLYLAAFRRDAGAADDPIERVLVDQLVLSHHKVGQLHAAAENTSNIDFKQAYMSAATRLLREICRTVQTLAFYRQSPRQRGIPLADEVASEPVQPKEKGGRRKGK
jgi:hypothetical protein